MHFCVSLCFVLNNGLRALRTWPAFLTCNQDQWLSWCTNMHRYRLYHSEMGSIWFG